MTDTEIDTEVVEHDFTNVENAEEAADKFEEVVRDIAEAHDHDPDTEMLVCGPEEAQEKRGYEDGREVYIVGYEAGPFEWAVRMIGGGTIDVYDLETNTIYKHKLEGFWDNDAFHAECHFSFEVHIYGGR